MSINKEFPYKLATYGGIAFLFFLAFGVLKPFAIVKAGQRGVVMRFGKVQDTILDEGLHLMMPIVNTIYQRIGDETEIITRIINPAVAEIVKAATAQKNAEEIITKRKEVKQEIDIELKERLNDYGILVDDVSLVNVSFSPEFTKAIEAKQIAEQQAKQADYEALKAEKTAQAEINRAKGQAEAQRLQKLTLTPAFLQKEAITKWDGKFPLVMGGEGTLPFINIDPQQVTK
ncbi:prohibitin family protein [Waterburya agarophytonicola K14]|uniref:Prohibitin family protein n=1 Tax=Waterburya agarophytonicola KI4 TaxID=2874699 RepID=A0A964FHW8_9CYAN|nr:prohibitin family protein [Waterburya agarophytonicola]MCC0177853.1 prohibitin family protein [Waterburya agarophytonicola KI4]